MKKYISNSVVIMISLSFALKAQDSLLFEKPAHGFVSRQFASRWEEGLLVGNGTIGALVYGNPLDETIIISHENLFMPDRYPYETAPLIKNHLTDIRENILSGNNNTASSLLVQAGRDGGYNDFEEDLLFTDPLIPACQLVMESLNTNSTSNYTRGINYESGEARVAYNQDNETFDRTIFVSRTDSVGVIRLSSSGNSLDFRFRLEQLPNAQEGKVLLVESGAAGDSLYYHTIFTFQWDGSLKGYHVAVKIKNTDGSLSAEDGWITVSDASEIVIYFDVQLSHSLPIEPSQHIHRVSGSYSELLEDHENIHAEMFNRFSLQIGDGINPDLTAEDIIARNKANTFNNNLVNQLCEASRYISISSTGDNPPALQGIWGGTWRPDWSSDFTLNGNIQSAIASGFNTNLFELTESYINLMLKFYEDFENLARGLYDTPGIMIPSRVSNTGFFPVFNRDYPMICWYAGSAWAAQYFYDYWQYTGDMAFLTEKAIPFMRASMDFYKSMITYDNHNNYAFIPSYSPEQGPREDFKLAINATMDVAALRQLSSNLLALSHEGYLEDADTTLWQNYLEGLPEYQIQSNNDFKEWLWDGYSNENEHRHASHFYPLWYEPDVKIINDSALLNALMVGIDKRLEHRREWDGGIMSYGIFQKGLAAAHISAGKLAYECVELLSETFWNKAFNSYHDPFRIFNVDITGGLPALVTDMLVQSAHDTIHILPALYYHEWSDGKVSGVQTRSGVTVNLEWRDSIPYRVELIANRNTSFTLKYNDYKKALYMNLNDTIVLTSDSLPNELPYLRPEPVTVTDPVNSTYKSGSEDMMIYPNPSDGGAIHIQLCGWEEEIGIRIRDINGRTVLEMEKTNGKYEVLNIPLENYAKGIYIISVSSNRLVKNARLVIQ